MDGAFGPLQPAMCVCVCGVYGCLRVPVGEAGRGVDSLKHWEDQTQLSWTPSNTIKRKEGVCVYINDNKTCFKKNEEEKTKNKQWKVFKHNPSKYRTAETTSYATSAVMMHF